MRIGQKLREFSIQNDEHFTGMRERAAVRYILKKRTKVHASHEALMTFNGDSSRCQH